MVYRSKNNFMIVEIDGCLKAEHGHTGVIYDIVSNPFNDEYYPKEAWDCIILSHDKKEVEIHRRTLRMYERENKYKKLYLKSKETNKAK